MPKIELSPAFSRFRGKLGNLVILELNGQLVARRTPERKAERTPAEKAQNERMRLAAEYAKEVKTDPVMREFYKALPCQPGLGPYHLAVRDFHYPPVVEDIDVSNYRGKAGESIRITATDDSAVVQLSVQIKDLNDGLIEEGLARLDTTTDRWCYVAMRDLPTGQAVTIQAVAKDRPGHMGSKSCLGYAR